MTTFEDSLLAHFSEEIQEEANAYLQEIYGPNAQMSVNEFINRLKMLRQFALPRDQELLMCIVKNLFDGYQFFLEYPETELQNLTEVFRAILCGHLRFEIELACKELNIDLRNVKVGKCLKESNQLPKLMPAKNEGLSPIPPHQSSTMPFPSFCGTNTNDYSGILSSLSISNGTAIGMDHVASEGKISQSPQIPAFNSGDVAVYIQSANCTSQLCQNGGICLSNAGADSSQICQCPAGFHGSTGQFDVNECFAGNGGCKHECVNMVGNFYCKCHPGFEFDKNARNCIDVDECAISNVGCQHRCVNTLGDFLCQWLSSLQLAPNGRDCIHEINYGQGNGGCEQICEEKARLCRCRNGFKLGPDKKSCQVTPFSSSFAGIFGDKCDQPCMPFWTHGSNCRLDCRCSPEGTDRCDPQTGQCHCLPGFNGLFCHRRCPFGYYGQNCAQKFECPEVMECDQSNGECLAPHSMPAAKFKCSPAYTGTACEVCPSGRFAPECAIECNCQSANCQFADGRIKCGGRSRCSSCGTNDLYEDDDSDEEEIPDDDKMTSTEVIRPNHQPELMGAYLRNDFWHWLYGNEIPRERWAYRGNRELDFTEDILELQDGRCVTNYVLDCYVEWLCRCQGVAAIPLHSKAIQHFRKHQRLQANFQFNWLLCNVEIILIPCHLHQIKHWAMCIANIRERTIKMYDSMNKNRLGTTKQRFMADTWNVLNSIARLQRWQQFGQRNQWFLWEEREIPQQANGFCTCH